METQAGVTARIFMQNMNEYATEIGRAVAI
jgi:hypothetical protein